ncbi:MAG: CGNR zinc finger domain-containing protein [Planctomycetota bacterium]|jgi:predicted RNA-binding Zn ribbon-like protein
MSETKLIGGELCLDFVNTVGWHASDSPQESLVTYEDLVVWGVHAGILDDASAKRLLREAKTHPSQAKAVLKRAIDLRESIYRIFVGVVAAQSPNASDLEAVNAALSQALRHLRVRRVEDEYAWVWVDRDRALDSILWPVLRSAADVLTSRKRLMVGQCADDRGCGWLFLDSSKNRSRRWCVMEDCGNRAKALRHYERTRRSRSKMVR